VRSTTRDRGTWEDNTKGRSIVLGGSKKKKERRKKEEEDYTSFFHGG
jgi:hypothetical protein